jgi:imidazolonepropionase-like amidohydrolase
MATVFFAKTLIDGTGKEPVSDAAVLVDNGHITQVDKRDQVKYDVHDYQVVDLGEMTLLPGLIDAHCHIFYIVEPPRGFIDGLRDPYTPWEPQETILRIQSGLEGARRWLSQGVTTVRDVGSDKNLDLGLRDLIAQRKAVGPRIFGSGRPIVMTGRPLLTDRGLEVNSADEARRAAREQLQNGADLIKLFASAGVGGSFGKMIGESGWEQLTLEELQAATYEAHKAGRTAVAHAMHPQSIKNSILAGVDTIEHGTYADEECIDLMHERQTYIVPTLAIGEVLAKRGSEFGFGPHMQVNAQHAVEMGRQTVAMALQAGVRIAVGTDPVRPLTYADECLCLQQAGMPVMDIVVAATRHGAELLHMSDKLGTLEPGKIADLVALDGNPLKDLHALERVKWVVKEGQIFQSSDISNGELSRL